MESEMLIQRKQGQDDIANQWQQCQEEMARAIKENEQLMGNKNYQIKEDIKELQEEIEAKLEQLDDLNRQIKSARIEKMGLKSG